MDKLIEFLKGKKTYLIGAAMAVSAYLKLKGYIDQPTFELILTLLGASGLMALRAGVNNEVASLYGQKSSGSKGKGKA